jgi:serine/threonine protein kinase
LLTLFSLSHLFSRFLRATQGLKTLQDTGLCHRNLSLDAVAMDGDHIDICQLGWALRYNPHAAANDDDDCPLPPPGGLDPHYIAPEYFGLKQGTWDGFSADLWAAGLMLFSMVVGSDALFTAPIAEDKSFARMCIKGDIRGQAKRYGKLVGKDTLKLMSNELVDLLKNMLRAESERRFSLPQVMEHPWLTNNEVITAAVWTQRTKTE